MPTYKNKENWVNGVSYLTPGFHSDVVWLEDQRDYAETLMGTMKQHLTVCRFDTDFGVFLHELTYLKPYLDKYPEERAFVRELIAEGRAGTAGSHSQPSETLIDGEFIIRNILYGRLYHEKCLKDTPIVYMPYDVFGHCNQLPQILAKSRFKCAMWSKPIWGCHTLMHQIAPDGTDLLVARIHYMLTAHRPRDPETGKRPPVHSIEEIYDMIVDSYQEPHTLGLSCNALFDCFDFKPPTGFYAGLSAELRDRPHKVLISGTAHRKFVESSIKDIEEKDLELPVTAR
ncbi:hypothetical protein ACFL1X_05960, partial [Candidatus Hydrogenedentota bacterium]